MTHSGSWRRVAAAISLLALVAACQRRAGAPPADTAGERRCAELFQATSRSQRPGSSTPRAAGEPLHVTYEYANWSLPFLVAMEAGLFDKHGVAVAPRKLEGSSTLSLPDMEIVNGHGMYLLKAAGAAPGVLRFVHAFAMKKDGDMVQGLLAKKSAGIRTWKDLSKKQISMSFNGMGILQKALVAEGLTVFGDNADISSFRVRTGAGAAKAFAEDPSAHALFGWASEVRELQEKRPDDYVLLAKNLESTYVADPYYVGCTYVTMRIHRDRPDAVRRYVAAIDEAIDLVRSCPKAALGLVPKYFEFTPEEAARLGTYHFHKSTEPLDLEALRKSQEADLAAFVFRGDPDTKP